MRSFLKGASFLALSQGVVAASTFLRNVVIARHISVADFGIATTFALTMSLLEMISNLSFDLVLIQDDEGGSDRMLASAHLLQFARGVVSSVVLFFLAGPVALLFELPEVTWAFQVLALVPAIRGLVHWDMVVQQRQMDFKAGAIVDALPQVLSLTVAYFAALWLKDYRVMLTVVLCQVALTTLISHLVSKRPYRWLFNADLAKKKLAFGWPLLVNGLLMFGIFQGDRVLVGAIFNMETLGWYSVAFSLVLSPTLIFGKVCGSLLLPRLSRAKHDPEQFSQECVLAIVMCFGCGAFIATFFAIGGKAVLLLAFGERYAKGNDLLLLLAISQAIRTMRIAPALIANSQARTKNAMYSNLFRTVALPLAFGLAWLGYGVEWVAASAIAGEILGAFVSFRMLDLGAFTRRFVRQTLVMSVSFALLIAAAFVAFTSIGDADSVVVRVLLVMAGSVLGIAMALAVPAVHSDTRNQAYALWTRLHRWRAARRR